MPRLDVLASDDAAAREIHCAERRGDHTFLVTGKGVPGTTRRAVQRVECQRGPPTAGNRCQTVVSPPTTEPESHHRLPKSPSYRGKRGILHKCDPVWCGVEVWYAACTLRHAVAIVDVAIILGGILLAAWLVDGQRS